MEQVASRSLETGDSQAQVRKQSDAIYTEIPAKNTLYKATCPNCDAVLFANRGNPPISPDVVRNVG